MVVVAQPRGRPFVCSLESQQDNGCQDKKASLFCGMRGPLHSSKEYMGKRCQPLPYDLLIRHEEREVKTTFHRLWNAATETRRLAGTDTRGERRFTAADPGTLVFKMSKAFATQAVDVYEGSQGHIEGHIAQLQSMLQLAIGYSIIE
jgi:hypothetical protein